MGGSLLAACWTAGVSLGVGRRALTVQRNRTRVENPCFHFCHHTSYFRPHLQFFFTNFLGILQLFFFLTQMLKSTMAYTCILFPFSYQALLAVDSSRQHYIMEISIRLERGSAFCSFFLNVKSERWNDLWN